MIYTAGKIVQLPEGHWNFCFISPAQWLPNSIQYFNKPADYKIWVTIQKWYYKK